MFKNESEQERTTKAFILKVWRRESGERRKKNAYQVSPREQEDAPLNRFAINIQISGRRKNRARLGIKCTCGRDGHMNNGIKTEAPSRTTLQDADFGRGRFKLRLSGCFGNSTDAAGEGISVGHVTDNVKRLLLYFSTAERDCATLPSNYVEQCILQSLRVYLRLIANVAAAAKARQVMYVRVTDSVDLFQPIPTWRNVCSSWRGFFYGLFAHRFLEYYCASLPRLITQHAGSDNQRLEMMDVKTLGRGSVVLSCRPDSHQVSAEGGVRVYNNSWINFRYGNRGCVSGNLGNAKHARVVSFNVGAAKRRSMSRHQWMTSVVSSVTQPSCYSQCRKPVRRCHQFPQNGKKPGDSQCGDTLKPMEDFWADLGEPDDALDRPYSQSEDELLERSPLYKRVE
ncbi:hypothetical protein BDZ89DRAFT_1207492 [Hymenopellis radicata]|nr:hypothetical protein BDZ89DRAFT_1207492 [Hymenopellis radicata]